MCVTSASSSGVGDGLRDEERSGLQWLILPCEAQTDGGYHLDLAGIITRCARAYSGDVPLTIQSHMPILPCPRDFADHASAKTNRALAEKYGVGEKTITRWRKETGCTAAIRPFASAALPKQHVPAISAGAASEAAQFLRKTHRPVYHRLIEGKEYGGQYVVGTQLLSEREVVELAEEKGFRQYDRMFDATG